MALLRIVILGCAGSGKTTLARRLGALTRAKVVVMDELCVGKIRPEDVPVFRKTFSDALPLGSWITDGNYSEATFDLRIPIATHVIWLEAPRFQCLLRSVTRLFRRGEGHSIKELPMVVNYLWHFDKKSRLKILRTLANFEPHVPVTHIQSTRDYRELLDLFGTGKERPAVSKL